MSLYGLDFVKARDGRYFLVEINGIRSGMEGFKKIYGDNRVEDKVSEMIKEKYPNLSYNVGKYSWQKFLINNSKKLRALSLISKIPSLAKNILKISESYLAYTRPGWTKSELAEKDFASAIQEKTFDNKSFWPETHGIPEYMGQDSVVINLINEKIPIKTINDYVCESLTNNKFFQYILLNNTEVQKYLPHSTLVGLGTTDEGTILQLARQYDKFAVKPIKGLQGVAVKFVSSDELLKKYAGSSGPVTKDHDLINLRSPMKEGTLMLENLAASKNFSFEIYLSLVQPFINSRTSKSAKYKSIRAIVCNGKFVDAYSRVSESKVVNLAQGSEAEAFNHDAKFINLCEKVVKCLESEASKLPIDKFKELIYVGYLMQIREMNEGLGFKQDMPMIKSEERGMLKELNKAYPLVIQHMINISDKARI
jgi:hypothetical protein